MDWAEESVEQLYVEIGLKVRATRLDRSLKQDELAEAVGLNRSSVANIEAGRQKMLIHSLIRIAESLDVTIDALLPDADRLRQLADSPRFVPDMTGHTAETQDFVNSALRRSREGTRGAAEAT